MEQANWACEWCGNRDENLQIHHGYYGKGDNGKRRDPWEYPDSTLWTLCDTCHEKAESARAAIYYEIAKIHPKHHWELRRFLHEVQALIEEDPSDLKNRNVVEPEDETEAE